MKKRGEITVFLSIILTLVLSFVGAVIESGKMHALRMKLELVADMGMDSILAEYQKELLERYDLFFADGSYGSGTFDVEQVRSHLQSYLYYNITPKKETHSFHTEFLPLSLGEIELFNFAQATDESGAVFKRQAVAFMEDKLSFGLLEQLMPEIEAGKKNWEKRNEVKKKKEQTEKKRKEIEIPEEIKEELEDKDKNPIEAVVALQSKGILSCVLKNPKSVSKKQINLSGILSKRQLVTGVGCQYRLAREDPVSDILFGEYILEKMSYATQISEEEPLCYQVEYILSGKGTDSENLAAVAKQLLLLREGANFIYLLGDTAKCEEAKALAAVLVGFTGLEALIEVTKTAILLAWAYGEGIVDVRRLLSGGKVPLMKNKQSWQLTMTQLLQLDKNLDAKGKDQSSGWSYQQYLRVFLALQDKNQKVMRTMDMVEGSVRSVRGNENFCLDSCFEGFTSEIHFQSGRYAWSIERGYYY